MADILETVLLLALPASGKSEARRYLDSLPPDVCENELHIGQTVQLDDFPYVHYMRRIDDELIALGRDRLFFEAPDRSFRDGRDWGTLIQLINEDYDDLVARNRHEPDSAALAMFERLDAASERAGADKRLATLDAELRSALADRLEEDARQMLAEKHAGYPNTLENKTVVIEFARGGPEGSAMPLPAPYGYRHSLGQLSERILERASVLYIWVTPEESRRKNVARADPDDPGSILHHGVPEFVMRNEYGLDDIDWLLESSDKPNTIEVEAHGKTFYLPTGRFDNRVDKTTFIREDKEKWSREDVETIHAEIARALGAIAKAAGIEP